MKKTKKTTKKTTARKTTRKKKAVTVERQKVVWKVFNANFKEVACYPYPEKAAAEASEEAEKKLKEMDERIAAGGDNALKNNVKAALAARDKAGEAARRAAKALTKAEEAARVAENLGAKPPDAKNEGKET